VSLKGAPFMLCYVLCRIFEAFHDSLFFFLSKDGIASKVTLSPSLMLSGKSDLKQKKDSLFSVIIKQNG
jgi:hypothetical protein